MNLESGDLATCISWIGSDAFSMASFSLGHHSLSMSNLERVELSSGTLHLESADTKGVELTIPRTNNCRKMDYTFLQDCHFVVLLNG